MARLFEFQGKQLLASNGIPIPRGEAAQSATAAADAAGRINGPVVIKAQTWTTGRAAQGGIVFAQTPDEVKAAAARLLQMTAGGFKVETVLVEEKLAIAQELFFSLAIDDRARSPVILLSCVGGSGIEERAAEVQRIPCAIVGPDEAALQAALSKLPIPPQTRPRIAEILAALFRMARAIDARSLEINPLAVLKDGRVIALDCRIAIDDYAVARHPELGIEFARELDHPPTSLEKIAYAAEQADHRGTFFFAQMNVAATPGSKGLIGFHGAGGGGSMMSMDAITNEGFTIANFCDTSGNPSPAKVYRAARIILSQPGLVGYFGSGSGVANQEQYWSAYGLAKAFWELDLDIPAVIRLGGNTEDRAVEILQSACKGLPAKVEGYKKNDSPAKIAARFAAMVVGEATERRSDGATKVWQPRPPRRPRFVGAAGSVSIEVRGGRVWIDTQAWKKNAVAIVARSNGLLRDAAGRPESTATAEALQLKDSDFIACEVECRRDGIQGIFVELDMPGFDGAAKGAR